LQWFKISQTNLFNFTSVTISGVFDMTCAKAPNNKDLKLYKEKKFKYFLGEGRQYIANSMSK